MWIWILFGCQTVSSRYTMKTGYKYLSRWIVEEICVVEFSKHEFGLETYLYALPSMHCILYKFQLQNLVLCCLDMGRASDTKQMRGYSKLLKDHGPGIVVSTELIQIWKLKKYGYEFVVWS